MKGFIVALLAETPLHPGVGQIEGVVDLPVARERTTGLPQIPETGLKGALRQWAKTEYEKNSEDVTRLFGTAEASGAVNGGEIPGGAGDLLISTARLLFLPVRQLNGPYVWSTTPYLLERLGRDAERAKLPLSVPKGKDQRAIKPEKPDQLLWIASSGETSDNSPVFLEEYIFEVKNAPCQKEFSALIGELLKGSSDKSMAERLTGQAAIMDDGEFSWFAENALPVDARNSLDENKMSENLWYEETLPPDTLLYALILPRRTDDEAKTRFETFKKNLRDAKYIQVGGNETVGHGWLRVNIIEE